MNTENENLFRVVLSSDVAYEEMVIYIFSQSGMIAIVDQEKGPNKKEIEVFYPTHIKDRRYSLHAFRKCLEKAEERLDDSQRTIETYEDTDKS